MGDGKATKQPPRLIALDLLRGVAVVLMALDHVSLFLGDSRWKPATLGAEAAVELPAAEFLTRWLAYLCAPVFLLLLGAVLVVSIERRRARGASEREIDRHLLMRGAFLALLDPVLLSLGAERVWLQVLWAIGISVILLIPLRRLPARALVFLGLAWWILGEAVTRALLGPAFVAGGLVDGVLLAPFEGGRVALYYPLVPWFSVVLVGWGFGRAVVARERRGEPALSTRTLVRWGLILLAAHASIRALDGYGNMGTPPGVPAALAWLHVNKEVPSASFWCLELGCMALLLAVLNEASRRWTVRPNNPLLVFGRAALFFYVVHWMGLRAVAALTDLHGRLSLGLVWIGAVLLLAALYPVCVLFLTIKRAHPHHWLLRYF